jgi:hypothetical protein
MQAANNQQGLLHRVTIQESAIELTLAFQPRVRRHRSDRRKG